MLSGLMMSALLLATAGPERLPISLVSGWTNHLSGGSILALALSDDGRLFAASANPLALFVSDDHGESWTSHPLSFPNGSDVADLIAVGDPTVLYAATFGDGVWRSPDGGASWTAFGTACQRAPSTPS